MMRLLFLSSANLFFLLLTYFFLQSGELAGVRGSDAFPSLNSAGAMPHTHTHTRTLRTS